MPKIKAKRYIFLLSAVASIVFDVFVVTGWALSLFYLAGSIYWLIVMRNRASGGYGFKAIVGLSVFIITTLSGYTLTNFVGRDFTQFSVELGNSYPKDKDELLLLSRNRLAWITRKSLLSYANVDGKAIAKLRTFPYRISEYDFDSRRLISRSYD